MDRRDNCFSTTDFATSCVMFRDKVVSGRLFVGVSNRDHSCGNPKGYTDDTHRCLSVYLLNYCACIIIVTQTIGYIPTFEIN